MTSALEATRFSRRDHHCSALCSPALFCSHWHETHMQLNIVSSGSESADAGGPSANAEDWDAFVVGLDSYDCYGDPRCGVLGILCAGRSNVSGRRRALATSATVVRRTSPQCVAAMPLSALSSSTRTLKGISAAGALAGAAAAPPPPPAAAAAAAAAALAAAPADAATSVRFPHARAAMVAADASVAEADSAAAAAGAEEEAAEAEEAAILKGQVSPAAWTSPC